MYGFGLILFVLMLAFVYNATCSAAEEEFNKDRANDKSAASETDREAL